MLKKYNQNDAVNTDENQNSQAAIYSLYNSGALWRHDSFSAVAVLYFFWLQILRSENHSSEYHWDWCSTTLFGWQRGWWCRPPRCQRIKTQKYWSSAGTQRKSLYLNIGLDFCEDFIDIWKRLQRVNAWAPLTSKVKWACRSLSVLMDCVVQELLPRIGNPPYRTQFLYTACFWMVFHVSFLTFHIHDNLHSWFESRSCCCPYKQPQMVLVFWFQDIVVEPNMNFRPIQNG